MILTSFIYSIATALYLSINHGKFSHLVPILVLVLCSIFMMPYLTNNLLELFEVKYAEFFGYSTWSGKYFVNTFVPQAVLLYPIFELTNSPEAVYALNIGLTSGFVAWIVSRRNRLLTTFAILCIPNYYFSMFGLRDPLLGVVASCVLINFYNLFVRKQKILNLIFLALNSYVMFLSRPEFVILIPACIFFFVYLSSKRLGKIFVIVLGMLVASLGIFMAPKLLGVNISAGSFDFILEFAANRYERHAGEEGGRSHILGGNLFSLPFFIRFPIQVASFWILPNPVAITGIADIIALVDSVLFGIFTLKFIKILKLQWDMEKIEFRALLSISLGCLALILVMSLFSSNYGNLFRLRYVFWMMYLTIALNFGYKKKYSRKV